MSLYIYVEDPDLRKKYNDYISTRRTTDSGVDLFVPLSKCIKGTTKIGLGIVVASKDLLGNNTPSLLLARSSITKTPLRLANSIGLIDAGYRGEVGAVVDNICDVDYMVNTYDRLFQICAHDFMPFLRVKLVDKLEDLPAPRDDRGAGGFGSTGK